jgi:hypothetical protein
LRLFGIAVVNRQGQAASRGRLIARALVVWIPVVAGTLVIIGLATYIHETPGAWERGSAAAMIVLTVVVLCAAVVFALVRPAKGIQDFISRTRLVPL